jgi:glycosyltransferase involved in cell wall biosynthesis
VRILILNWRCPKNPRAGGAEILTYQIARRLVAQGDTVEWFAASFPDAAPQENLDGVRIVRAGGQWTVHLKAFGRYRGKLRGQFDAVIDEVNTIPFFTPLWAGIPVYMLIFQLARAVWWYESKLPLSAIGYSLEPLYLRLYRHVIALTISRSTENDLRRLGFVAPIVVFPVGIDPADEPAQRKASSPTFLYVGRLAPSKRVADIVEAFAKFRAIQRDGQLWLVGEGSPSYVRLLRHRIAMRGLTDNVALLGWLSTKDKYQRMAQAHVLVMASVREGWGLVVTEANSRGTPAVVYDVPGLRDSVQHGQTGLVVEPNPAKLAEGMLELWNDSDLYQRTVSAAVDWSRRFTFDRAAAVVRNQLTATARE